MWAGSRPVLPVAGCGIFTLAVSILAGVWTVTPAAPGDFGDWGYQATFNSSGKLVELSAESPDGAMVELEIDNATSQASGSDGTVTIPAAAGTRVFERALSADQNTLTWSLGLEGVASSRRGASGEFSRCMPLSWSARRGEE